LPLLPVQVAFLTLSFHYVENNRRAEQLALAN